MPRGRRVLAAGLRQRAIAATLVLVVLSAGPAVAPVAAANRVATLAVAEGKAWRAFWTAEAAPSRWDAADPFVSRALEWRRLAPGADWATLRLACEAPVWRARLIVARLDPRLVDLTLAMDLSREDARPAWTIDRAPHDAVLAVNAGQFTRSMPWGWVLIDGRQRLRPGSGPLSSAVAIDGAGSVSWVHGDSLAEIAGVVTGFQSYPTLLASGAVPQALRTAGSGVSRTHHDIRLALGETRDRRLLIVMTRFDAMGEGAGAFPLGPTTPEMAAIMGALGASDAVMLDGGISAQLLLRNPEAKAPLEWKGMRRVPLALIARPRKPPEPPRPPRTR